MCRLLADAHQHDELSGQITTNVSITARSRSNTVLLMEKLALRKSAPQTAPVTINEVTPSTKTISSESTDYFDSSNEHSPANFIIKLKNGDVTMQSFKDPTNFRARRGSFTQGIVEDPGNKEVFEQRRTTIYASSEMGITQEFKAPFPSSILGTFSCHGITPAEEAEPDDMMRLLMGGGCDDVAGKIHQKTNQDRGCVVYPFNSSTSDALFLVLDGHGDQGDRVAEFAMRQIVLTMETHPCIKTNPILALHESFVTTNKALSITKDIKSMTSGTTVVAAYIQQNQMFIANVGDSRAVLASASPEDPTKCVATILSTDHKPDSPGEYERIVAAKGYVSLATCSNNPSNFHNSPSTSYGPDADRVKDCSASARVWLNPEHTLVGLAMSRSIGDLAVKRAGVIPDPTVMQRDVQESDKFLILASDGVWEFMSHQVCDDIYINI